MGKRVVVVGGGVVGLLSAYYLSLDGHEVEVVDRDAADAERCSSGNSGLLVPSHFVPLAAPGMIGMGLRMMLDPKGPFRIKPRMSSALLRWMALFARASTQHRVAQAAPVLRDLSLLSLRLYEDLAQDLEFGFQQRGVLLVCASESTLHHEARTAELGATLGLESSVLDPEQLARVESSIKYATAGAVFYPGDGSVDPNRLLRALQERLVALGVKFQWNKRVDRFHPESGRILRVETSSGPLEADEFVLASGSWSPELVGELGVKLPMQAGKGYSMLLDKPPAMPSRPALLIEGRVALSPLEHGLRVGGTMEIAGLDLGVDRRRVDGIIESLARYAPTFNPSTFEGVPVWKGLRPCSPDGLPYIGPLSQYPNLIAATGHSMLGVSTGPATGRLVAEYVANRTRSVATSLLSPNRYD